MNFFLPRSVWIRALLISLIFTACAVSVRYFWDYPRCQNDELNWVHIAHHIDAGHDWPVSGPMFMLVLRSLNTLTEMRYVQLISGLGVFSVFVGTLLIILGYSRLRISRPDITLATLALSSYFWVPLLEARPQQWGQIQVFIGVIGAWLWLHRRGGWWFFPVLVLASVTHILSHTILVFVCTVLALADFFENRPLTRRHAMLIASALLSSMVYLLPEGPYQTMLHDIEQNHLRSLLSMAPYCGTTILAMVFALVALKPRLHWRAHWSRATLSYALTHQFSICVGFLLIFVVLMLIQSSVLPAASWLPYGGSIGAFVVFQTGNLVFAGLFLSGVFHFLRDIDARKIDSSNARMVIWALLAFGALGLLTLAASFFMLNSNWLLRLINYAILFSAPIAALGLHRFSRLQQHPWLYVFCVPLFIVSICQAIRPSELLAC